MIRLSLFLLLALTLCACRSARPEPAPVAAPAVEVVYDDAFASFGGTVINPGDEVTLHREPIGVSDLRALVALGRTEWVIHTLADGKEDKTATANFVIQRGGDAKNVRIQSGDKGSALGVSIQVIEAGEVYEETSMRWVQFAKVLISAGP